MIVRNLYARIDRKPHSHEKDPVGKAGQGVHLAITVGKSGIGRPLAHDSRTESNDQRKAVKEHVDTVTEQSKGAG